MRQMANSELDRLKAKGRGLVDDLVTEAFEAGVKHERFRLTALINADLQPRDASGPVQPVAAPASRQPSGGASANYGKAINAVRAATKILPIGPGGIDIHSISGYLSANSPELKITDEQVRTAIKQLVNRGELE